MEIAAAEWSIAAIPGWMKNRPGTQTSVVAAGGPPSRKAVSVCKEVKNNCQLGPAPVDGDGGAAYLVANGAAGQLQQPVPRSTSSAIPADWDSPSRESVAGRTRHGQDGELVAAELLSGAVQTG